MSTSTYKRWLALFVGLLLPALAQANAGKVLYAAGEVSVEREELLPLRKGDILQQGDVVITGPGARAQLLMIDGARISLRSDSRLALDTYKIDNGR
ncbi:MAG: hypothetical protein V2J89_09455, partial [Halieaceae bacterium]|nr:hypothetical protein [Halieaceae bacterium]